MTAPPAWRARAHSSFVAMLRREPYKSSKAADAGIAFERTVYRACRQQATTLGSEEFKTVVLSCIGGKFQSVLKSVEKIDDQEVVFYGKSDVEFTNTIKDIKTTGTWKGPDSYLKKWQHKIYLLISGKQYFDYIIVEWADDNKCTIKNVHIVPYTSPGRQALLDEIYPAIAKLFTYLHNELLWDDYYFTFSNNK